jgi:hypothetical protein
MKVIHLQRNGESRCICPESKTIVFVFKGKPRVSRLGCAVTHIARLVEVGWSIHSIEDDRQ